MRIESAVSSTWPRLRTAVFALPLARPHCSAWLKPATSVFACFDIEIELDAPPTAKKRSAP